MSIVCNIGSAYPHIADIEILGRVATTEISAHIHVVVLDYAGNDIRCWYALCPLCCKEPIINQTWLKEGHDNLHRFSGDKGFEIPS